MFAGYGRGWLRYKKTQKEMIIQRGCPIFWGSLFFKEATYWVLYFAFKNLIIAENTIISQHNVDNINNVSPKFLFELIFDRIPKNESKIEIPNKIKNLYFFICI